jgi:hypothetical protein
MESKKPKALGRPGSLAELQNFPNEYGVGVFPEGEEILIGDSDLAIQ